MVGVGVAAGADVGMVGDGVGAAGAVGVGVGVAGAGVGDDAGELGADPVGTGAGEPAVVPGGDGGTAIGGVDTGTDALAGDGRETLIAVLAAVVRLAGAAGVAPMARGTTKAAAAAAISPAASSTQIRPRRSRPRFALAGRRAEAPRAPGGSGQAASVGSSHDRATVAVTGAAGMVFARPPQPSSASSCAVVGRWPGSYPRRIRSAQTLHRAGPP